MILIKRLFTYNGEHVPAGCWFRGVERDLHGVNS